jgi:hypothetical protein
MKTFRNDKFDLFKLDRMAMSVLLVLFENYPLGISEKEIITKITEKGLLEMTDEEFNQYKKEVALIKEN